MRLEVEEEVKENRNSEQPQRSPSLQSGTDELSIARIARTGGASILD